MDKKKYQLTPKGIFATALTRTNLVEHANDWQVDAAWTIFQLMMEREGYVKDSDDE